MMPQASSQIFQKIFSDLTSSSSSLQGKAQTSLALRLLCSSVLREAHPSFSLIL